MKRISISAVNLAKEKYLTGIQRVSREIILRIDKLLADYPELCVEYIFQKSAPNNIIKPEEFHRIVPVEMKSSSIRMNQLFSIPNHIKKINSKGVCISVELLRSKGCITSIHDIRPYIFKTYDSFKFRLGFKFMLEIAKRYAKTIVTVSEYQKKDIVKYLNIKEENIKVIYNGWEHMNDIVADDGIFDKNAKIIKGKYFYALGSLAPHKNFKWIIEVAKRNPDKEFVIAGGKNLQAWKEDIETHDIPNVTFTGYVSDGENKALMQNCKAFLFPSKYEGFGIPPLEALACGAPIIISNATCLPEIYEDCAHYFDPNDYNVNLDELLKENVASPKKLLEKYSWDKAARQWIELMLRC